MQYRWRYVALALSGLVVLSGAAFVGREQWRVQVPTVPWSTTDVEPPERWPLLVESPHRAQMDLALHWRGEVVAGENWLRSQRRYWFSPWSLEHWAAREPTLYFVDPGGGELELELELGRRDRKAERGSMSAWLNGAALPSLDLAVDGVRPTVALPRELLVPGINQLSLRFEEATPVAGVSSRSGRSERWASFEKVALRQVGTPPSILDGRHLELRVGSAVRLPFSAATPTRMRMLVRRAPQSATLRVDAVVGQQQRTLLRQPISDGELLELDSPGDDCGRLELALEAAVGARAVLRLDVERLPFPDRATAVSAAERPNVFVFVVDTLRADVVDLRGGPESPTPYMARFAADAVVFEHALSPSSWTRPSTRALLDGVYPGSESRAADGSRWTLAQALSEAGYDTLAVSQSFVVSRDRFGMGFGSYYTSDALSRGSNEGHVAPWFLWHHLAARGRSKRPLFAYVHTIDPHGPYTPYAEDRRRLPWWRAWRPLHYGPTVVERDGRTDDDRILKTMRQLYSGDVRHADRSFGACVELLRFLGLYDTSLVILTSDHGEAFGEHGQVGHGRSLYEEELHVPLMIKLPGRLQAGRRVGAATSTVAVAPTILELLGAPRPAHLAEESLLSAQRRARPLRARLTRKARGTQPHQEMHAVFDGDLKCIGTTADSGELAVAAFDLIEDPREERPLDGAGALDRCRVLLAAGVESSAGADEDSVVSDEARKRLEALGYIDQL